MTRILGLVDEQYDNDDDDENGSTASSSFQVLQTTHTTLSQLRWDLPRLLQQPLTIDQVSRSHCEDTQFVVAVRGSSSSLSASDHNQQQQEEVVVLVSSIQELVSLQNALTYIAVLGPLRAQNFLLGDNALLLQRLLRTQPAAPSVKCRLVLLSNIDDDDDPKKEIAKEENAIDEDYLEDGDFSRVRVDRIQVDWKVPLVVPALVSGASGIGSGVTNFAGTTTKKDSSSSPSSKTTTTTTTSGVVGGGILQGRSFLELRNGKVSRHELRRIQLDGQTVDAAAIGRTLGQARKVFNQVQESSPEWVREWIVPNVQSLWQQYAKPWILDQPPPPPPPPLSEQQKIRDGTKTKTKTTTTKAESSNSSLEPNRMGQTNNNTTTTKDSNNNMMMAQLAPLLVQQKKRIGTTNETLYYIPIDEASANRSFPLPGSKQWSDYAMRHEAVVDFVDRIVPQLANPAASAVSTASLLFTPNCQLIATDKTTILVQGDSNVAELYMSLATLRKRTRGTWTFLGAELVVPTITTTPKTTTASSSSSSPLLQVRIRYQIKYPDAAAIATAASSMSGSDLYSLQYHVSKNDNNDNTRTSASAGVVTATATTTKISKIQQESMSIAGNSNPVDTTRFMRSLVAAVKNPNSAFFLTKTASSVVDDSWFFRLWDLAVQQQPVLVGGSGGRGSSSDVSSSDTTRLLARSDAAAASVYRLLVSLHTQGKQMVALDSYDDNNNGNNNGGASSVVPPVPGFAFMADQVELLGYIGETLVRGKSRYQQTVGLVVSSLRTSLRTGRVLLASSSSESSSTSTVPPVITKVEWTAEGTIQYILTLNLRLLLTPGLAPGELRFLRSGGKSNKSSGNTNEATTTASPPPPPVAIPGTTLPLKITLRSEYILDDATGQIVKHRLLESLVNDQLTPADILSRWLLRGGSGSSSNSGSNTLWSLNDFIKLVRTVAPPKQQ